MSLPPTASHEIHTRDDFSLLLNWRRLYQGAVEIGVDRGEFAQRLLAHWYGTDYVGIDDYGRYGEWTWSRAADMQVAATRLERHASRARLAVGKSAEVALAFRGVRKFDFVYIDGDHSELGVLADLEAWFDLVSPHGIIAGHDYDSGHLGVMLAVDKFFGERDMQIYLTQEPLPSWYAYRAGIPGSDWRRIPQSLQCLYTERSELHTDIAVHEVKTCGG